MTAKEMRIKELLNDMDLGDGDMCYEEYEVEFMKQSFNEVKDLMWKLYCFTNDVRDTLNM